MSAVDLLSVFFLALGVFFFFAAAVGLLRFPDTHSRLHALTKADNLGLGLTILAIMLHQESVWMIIKLALLRFITLVSSATNAYLLARRVQVEQESNTT